VPRKNTEDGEALRRKRGGKAATVEANAERGLVMRALLHSPKDTVAGVLASVAAGAVITNALFLQAGPHPAPMFGSTIVNLAATPAASSLLPRPRPAEADVTTAEPKQVERASESRNSEMKAGESRAGDPLASLVKATTPSSQPTTTAALSSSPNTSRPPAAFLQTPAARRVAAVQRALTEYGYGQLKATGTMGPDTQVAIQKFERERKLPVTGNVSDRLVRELGTMIGHPIDP
jgi:Putative peptidoglycan binding domain